MKNREVKKYLTKDDLQVIEDIFVIYAEYWNYCELYGDSNTERFLLSNGSYNFLYRIKLNDDKTIEIKMYFNHNLYKDVVSKMRQFKNRIYKYGFVSYGDPRRLVSHIYSSRREYVLILYKPMFPNKHLIDTFDKYQG